MQIVLSAIKKRWAEPPWITTESGGHPIFYIIVQQRNTGLLVMQKSNSTTVFLGWVALHNLHLYFLSSVPSENHGMSQALSLKQTDTNKPQKHNFLTLFQNRICRSVSSFQWKAAEACLNANKHIHNMQAVSICLLLLFLTASSVLHF